MNNGLFFVVFVLFLSGCAAPQTNPLTVQMPEIDGYAIEECDQQITLKNFDQILAAQRSGVYRNPFEPKECVPISLKIKEPFAYKQQLERHLDARALLTQFTEQEGQQVLHLRSAQQKVLRLLKYAESSRTQKQLRRRFSRAPLDQEQLSQFMFLHELFHLHIMAFDPMIRKQTLETLSDIATVEAFAYKHGKNTPEKRRLANALFLFRERERETHQPTHYDRALAREYLRAGSLVLPAKERLTLNDILEAVHAQFGARDRLARLFDDSKIVY